MATRKLVKESYGHLVRYRLYKKEISGHNSGCFHIVPESSLKCLIYGKEMVSLRRIASSLLFIPYSRHLIMDQLKQLLGALSSDDVEQIIHARSVTTMFKKIQGLNTMLSVLRAPEFETKRCDLRNCTCAFTIWDIRACALDVIRRLTNFDISFGEDLCEDNEIYQLLFSLMGHAHTYSRAAALAEHLLILRKDALQLDTIPGLDRLIAQLDGIYIGNFCNVLAYTISGPQVHESKPLWYAQNHLKTNKSSYVLQGVNQNFVLSIPEFLPRLVDYATRLPSEPWFEEMDHRIRLIDSSISNILGQNPSDDLVRYQAESFNLAQEGIGAPMEHRVETVYILRLLLCGNQREMVQAQLANLGLIPILSKLFDHPMWRSDAHQEPLGVDGHVISWGCEPEVAFKIEYLRLLQGFCDQSEHKYLMLTPTEYQEVCGLNDAQCDTLGQTSSPLNADQYSPDIMCSGSEGLLLKILKALTIEQRDSPLRFWFPWVIASYMQGSAQFANQLFLLRRGLLEYLVQSLLDADHGPDFVLQPNFDLLGELLKFNLDAFQRFDRLISDEGKEETFFQLMLTELVDSNILVRSLVLSHDHFTSEGGYPMQYAALSRTLCHVASVDHRVYFLAKLLPIEVTHITQDNVSCLNTLIVILMVARRRGELHLYLEGLRNYVGPDLLLNLRSLLLFWQSRYLHDRDEDCSRLHNTSGISFEFWQETVSTLLAKDQYAPDCILYYLTPEYLNMSLAE